jgi:hypothetical protein
LADNNPTPSNYFVLIHGYGKVELFMAKDTTSDLLAEACAPCVQRGHEVHIYELKPSTVGSRIQQVPPNFICLRQVFHDHPAEVEFEDLKTSIGGILDGHSYTMAGDLLTKLSSWIQQQMLNIAADKPVEASLPAVEVEKEQQSNPTGT